MTNDEWKKILEAKDLLGLPDQATLAEIKKAYRRLTEACQVLLEYGKKYKIPLVPGEDQPLEGEDWWMERFGDDPLWSPGRSK